MWLELHNPERDRVDFDAAWDARKGAGAAPACGATSRTTKARPSSRDRPAARAARTAPIRLRRAPGHHLAPEPLSSGKNVFEELGSGFTLLAFDADVTAVRAFEDAAAAAKVPLTIVRDTFAGERSEYEHKLILVRPDQYVSWTGDAPPADVPALLALVTGR